MDDGSRSLTLFGREVVSGTAAKGISALIRFATQIIFARVLGPGAYGSYHLLLSIVHVVDWPIGGWSDATKKRLSDGRVSQSEVISALLSAEIIFFTIAICLSYLLRAEIANYVQVDNSLIFLTLLLIHVLIFYPLLGILLAQERLAQAMWAETGHAILALLFQVYLLYMGYELGGLVVGLVLSTCITAVVFKNVVPDPTVPSISTFKSLWEYAKFSSIAKLVGKGYDRFDILLIGGLVGSVSVGYYEAASVLAAPALFSSNVISSGIMPTVSRLRSEDSDIERAVSTALRLSPILSIPVFFGSLTLSNELITTIYGSDYKRAASLLPWIALYYILQSISSPLLEIINGLDKPRYTAAISAGTLLINIVIGVVLGIQIGTLGIVLATVISEVIRLTYLINVVQRWDISVLSWMHLLMIAGGGIMTASVISYKHLFGVASEIELAFSVVLGAIVYFLFMFSTSSQLRQVSKQFFNRL